MTTIIESPIDITDAVFRAASSEQLEVIEKNEKRTGRFQEPLPIPAWNVQRMIENIKSLTARTFTPHFQRYAEEHPWNGKSSSEEWATIAINRLRDDYLIRIAHDDADLFRQLCEQWPEMDPGPDLNKEELTKLVELQTQADEIFESLLQTTKDAINTLYSLVQAEHQITKSTTAINMRLIYRQGGWFVGFLRDIINSKWNDLTKVNLVSHADEIERTHRKHQPGRWSK
jgi:hypothetical protein